jgi:hypothetical protein
MRTSENGGAISPKGKELIAVLRETVERQMRWGEECLENEEYDQADRWFALAKEAESRIFEEEWKLTEGGK